MQILIYVVIAIAIVIVAFAAFVSSRPNRFHVERMGQVNAPPEIPFSLVNNLSTWSKWSPFEKFDPQMKKTFEGPSSGPGASFAWNGNNKAGEGRVTIMEIKPSELVSIKLEFIRPFSATNHATFQFVPMNGGTRVTWAMEGKCNFVMKVCHLLMNMDKMIGNDFEEGLANLNAVAQSESVKAN